jgi:hypothetical protein
MTGIVVAVVSVIVIELIMFVLGNHMFSIWSKVYSIKMAPILKVRDACTKEENDEFRMELRRRGYVLISVAFRTFHYFSNLIVRRLTDDEDRWVMINCLINTVFLLALYFVIRRMA